jgi:cell division GTPase FtsZ
MVDDELPQEEEEVVVDDFDAVDLGDLPDIPDEPEDSSIADVFGYDVAFKIGFVGVGHAGGRLAETYWKLGYRSVAVVNTAIQDLTPLKLPDANKFDLGGGGAGKDPSIALAATEGRDEDFYDLFKRTLGDDLDYVIMCLGAGGGTGAGAWPAIHRVLVRYLEENKRPARVGAIVALPKDDEGTRPARNTIETLAGLMSGHKNLSPFIIVDNERVKAIFRKTSPAQFWAQCNNQVCSLFHLFNRIAAQDSPHTSFDRQDLASLLDGGVVSYGAAPIKEYKTPPDISKAIRQHLAGNILASIDLSTGDKAGCVFVCGKEAYSSMDQELLDHGFASLNRILKAGSTVFRGVYPGNNPDLRAYTMISGLDLPRTRIKELRRIAGLD